MKDIVIEGGKIHPFPDKREGASSQKIDSKGFLDTLRETLNEVNELQIRAENSINELANGEAKSLHETMILLEKADISFKLMMQIRNKLLDAYREIMHLQV
jgi:flagellar hook-basal body complex protein FliE